jgi:hypothetical protein
MEFTIVSNVEKPAARRNRAGRTAIYPFAKMAVGQSFKIVFNSEDTEEREKISRRIRTATLSFRKTHPEFAFETWTALTTDGAHEQDGDGIRVKRIAESKRAAKTVEAVVVSTAGLADAGSAGLSA